MIKKEVQYTKFQNSFILPFIGINYKKQTLIKTNNLYIVRSRTCPRSTGMPLRIATFIQTFLILTRFLPFLELKKYTLKLHRSWEGQPIHSLLTAKRCLFLNSSALSEKCEEFRGTFIRRTKLTTQITRSLHLDVFSFPGDIVEFIKLCYSVQSELRPPSSEIDAAMHNTKIPNQASQVEKFPTSHCC